MVCERCKTIVKGELSKLDVPFSSMELGEVITKNKISPIQRTQLFDALHQSGFELIDEINISLIERLKKAVIELESNSDEDLKTSYADYISLNVNDNFISLNTLFAEIKGITIDKYVIKKKIERVKELLVYNDLNLAEIAHKMNYSNVTQLSRQFKKITGLTPSHFRQLRLSRNNNLVIN